MSQTTDNVTLLQDAFPKLLDAWLQNLQEENPDLPAYLIDRHRKMAEYNCLGGKYFRGTQVLNFARLAAKNVDFATLQDKAIALGWAIEVMQAAFLVADDIMDSSQTRRGQVCWYLRPDVKNDAINDVMVLESFMHYLLEVGSDNDSYRQILKLYLDTEAKTQMGQTLDLLSMPQGKKSVDLLRTFDLALYKRIVKYKTAFYTFSLPMCAGLVTAGVRDAPTLRAVQAICMEIGEKFQIQDDYLDCYGAPEVIGKVGTDIQDHKCSWLCVNALAIMNDEQRARFEANYGHEDPAQVQIIRDIYNELDIPALYARQEEASLARINTLIEDNKNLVDAVWFEQIIKMVHGRKK